MFIAANKYRLAIRRLYKKSEVEEAVTRGSVPTLYLGDDGETPESYAGVVFSAVTADDPEFMVIVPDQSHGLEPGVLLLEQLDLAFCGFGQRVCTVSIANHAMTNETYLDWLFFTFLHDAERRIVLATSELGLVALDYEGKEKWRFGYDVETVVSYQSGLVRLTFPDGQMVELDVEDGRRL